MLTQEIIYNNGVKIPYENNFKRAYDKTILLCIEGGSAGRKIAILDREVCFGNKLCAFNANKIFYKFLFYYLQSNEFKKIFVENRTGIIGGVSIKKLKNIVLPIPPFAEQKRIVAKIEELLPYVERYEAAYNKLQQLNKRFPDDLQKSVLQLAIQGRLVPQRAEEGNAEDLYKQIQTEKQKLIKEGKIKKEKLLPPITDDEKPFEIPSNWKWVRLGEVLIIARGGSPRPIKSFITNNPNGINWIKIGDADKNGKYINRTNEKIIPEGLSKTRFVKKGDFLLSNSMSFGHPYILNIDGCIHDGWLVLSPIVEIFNKDFLYYLLSSSMVYNQFCRRVSGAVVNNLNSEKVATTLIPLPPLAEQKRIVAKIEELLPLCDKLK